jgi:hypothetical protein
MQRGKGERMSEEPPERQADAGDPAADARSGWFERHLGDEWELVAPGIYRRREEGVPLAPPPVEEKRLDESLIDALPGARPPEEDETVDRPRPRLGRWPRRR